MAYGSYHHGAGYQTMWNGDQFWPSMIDIRSSKGRFDRNGHMGARLDPGVFTQTAKDYSYPNARPLARNLGA